MIRFQASLKEDRRRRVRKAGDEIETLVEASQWTSKTHHQRGTVTHLHPEGGSLQAAPTRGRGNPNSSKTGKYCGQNPGRRGYFSSSVDTMEGTDWSNIGNDGRTI